MQYDAVVFDADGVLCEPTPRQTLQAAIRRALAGHGVPDPPAATIDRLADTTTEGLEEICETLGVGDAAAFWRARDNHASAAQRAAIRRGEKGLYDDITGALDLPVPRAIVSNNQQATVSFLLEHGGLADGFDPVIGRAPTLEDVDRKKPSPYHLERAVAELAADRPLFVGDSNCDLAAAAAAGIDSAFIRRDHRRDYVLEHEPTHEVASLTELSSLVAGRQPVASDD